MTKIPRLTPGHVAAVACALGLSSLQAQAQMGPWYVGLKQRLEHQSNVFQTAANAVSDTVSTTSVVGGLDQPIGRQRLLGSATLGRAHYQKRSDLSHDQYSGTLGLDWETAGNLSGNVTVDAAQSLADFTPVGLPDVTTDNITRTFGARASARLGAPSARLGFDFGGALRRTRFDNPSYRIRDLDIDEIYGGLRYRPGGSLVLGLRLRKTQGEYPKFRNPAPGRFTPEGFDRDNIDLIADWPLSGASTVNARLSFGKDRYDTVTARNFSGVTGAVAWRWQPTGRIVTNTSFTRNSGDDATVNFAPGQVPYATSAARDSNVLASSLDYDLTGKTKLRAGVSASETSAVDLLLGTRTREFVTGVTLGLTWEATRAITAGCDLALRNRASRTGVPGYDANVFGCYGQFVLR